MIPHLLRTFLQASALAAIVAAAPLGSSVAPANAQIAISISVPIAPPVLPVYEQPALPGPGYIWMPGYWAYADNDYFWVPGTWVRPPRIGFLWTPGYWAWNNDAYVFNDGYWGPTVGFYGGVVYGFGYTGVGFEGGYWRGRDFYYNRAFNNFGGTRITNVYNKTVIIRGDNNRVSFNGGAGGIAAKPTATQLAAARAEHVAPTGEQLQHRETAAKTPELHYAANKGKPPVAATAKPGELKGEGVTPASEPGAKRETAPKSEAAPKAVVAPTNETTPKAEAKPQPEPKLAKPAREPRPAVNREPPRVPAPHAAPPRNPSPAPHAAPPRNPSPAPRAAPPRNSSPAPHAAPPRNSSPAPHAAPPRNPAPAQNCKPPQCP